MVLVTDRKPLKKASLSGKPPRATGLFSSTVLKGGIPPPSPIVPAPIEDPASQIVYPHARRSKRSVPRRTDVDYTSATCRDIGVPNRHIRVDGADCAAYFST
jgi:hypothetical protein